ncbi:transglycosylase [Brevirhabdus pacifica]|uniref:Transglycosylase n=1 Tax=Brevirhabdus pacifica TaxID=1267768 RepID=A0A1U7DFR2_9RHOB|nr:lytic transglycosylase domain-containing protein [Brevirhabdus pacifica]APX88718.1 transglycosylase [Brevirhabdus pacifica]OWU79979.1 hypothetical protein ATO5_03050 [Loktanella sp. 22II-4b]PJJ86765.1 transglycosylase-like protein with SLT domain [Brevirhabdus pacifica]
MKTLLAGLLGLALSLPAPLSAEGARASSKSRAKIFSSQARLMDQRLSKQYAASVRLTPQYRPAPAAAAPGRPGVAPPRYSGSYKGQYLSHARQAARRHGIPEDLFLRLVQQESGWNPRAKSSKGALGLAQLMPATARGLGVDPHDPVSNLEGGARYLKRQFKRFGDWRHALAAYNAGPGAVAKYNGIPPYRETRNYVRIIWGH